MSQSSRHNPRVSGFSDAQTLLSFIAAAVGLAAGMGAVGFRWLIGFCQQITYGPGELLAQLAGSSWPNRLFIPAMGGLAVGLMVTTWAREARGHGVPEVMEAVVLKGSRIRKRLVVIKTLASAICIGTGGSVGREGPIVQIGSAIGSTFGQWLHFSAERTRALVGCGAAAGIAATFNAPIAGTMFALEIILGDFGLATFSPIVISAVAATVVSRHFLGNTPAFAVPIYQLISVAEFGLYLVLGLICAGLGVVLTRSLYAAEDLFGRLPGPAFLKTAAGGLAIGACGLSAPLVLGVGYEAIGQSLGQQLGWQAMFLLVAVKIMATSLTIGSGGSGGIFAPSLFIGAMAGGTFGHLVHGIWPAATASPGAYGIVGMAAVVSATTHGPLTAILMLFEMTGDYQIMLPLMMTCIISSRMAGYLFPESIYTFKLARRGVDIRAGREVNVLRSIPVQEVMTRQVQTVTEADTMTQLSTTLAKSRFHSFPVLNRQGELAGILSFADYRNAVHNKDLKDLIIVKDLARSEVVTVCTTDHLLKAMKAIAKKDFSILPVTLPDQPRQLAGVLSRRDIMRAYERAVIEKGLPNRR